jgi:type I restriction enzyme S subunit
MKLHPFSEVIADVTSKFRKIKASDYKAEGRFKIIDQGRKEIAGYTDDESLINKTHSPVIVFGDHTRALKYEESPIALGADGAKALAVNPKLANTLYIYYYLRSISLKGAGYSRHFKFLKQVEIPIPEENGKPNLDDQKRIAHLLGKVEGLIARRKQHLQQFDDLLKSVFLEMFGDPVRNEKGWNKPELKQFGKTSTGNTPPRRDPSNYSSQHIEWIKTDNISADSIFISQAAEYLSEAGATRARTVTKGALMVACIAGSVESIGRAALTNRSVAFNQQINAIQPKKNVNPLYLYVLFKISKAYIQSHASKGMKKILTKGDFEKITMIKPPVELQNQFAAIVEKVQGLKARYQQSLADLEHLYGALSQKAFKGELDLSRVPLSAEAPDKAEEQVRQPEAVPLDIEEQTQRFSTLDLPAMSSKDTRRNMLKQWFDEWLNGATASEELSPEGFWERARISALDYQGEDDETNEFFSEDYDLFKDWLFSAIERGLIRQTRNTVEGEEGTDFGNRVILRKAD